MTEQEDYKDLAAWKRTHQELEHWKKQAESAQWTLWFLLRQIGPTTLHKKTVEDGAPQNAAVLDMFDENDDLVLWAGTTDE